MSYTRVSNLTIEKACDNALIYYNNELAKWNEEYNRRLKLAVEKRRFIFFQPKIEIIEEEVYDEMPWFNLDPLKNRSNKLQNMLNISLDSFLYLDKDDCIFVNTWKDE